MAKIKYKDKEVEVPDNSELRKPTEELGVPFNCKHGTCGTCMIDVVSGEENLSDLTEQEDMLARDEKHRLACQCRIKKGEVEIDF